MAVPCARVPGGPGRSRRAAERAAERAAQRAVREARGQDAHDGFNAGLPPRVDGAHFRSLHELLNKYWSVSMNAAGAMRCGDVFGPAPLASIHCTDRALTVHLALPPRPVVSGGISSQLVL